MRIAEEEGDFPIFYINVLSIFFIFFLLPIAKITTLITTSFHASVLWDLVDTDKDEILSLFISPYLLSCFSTVFLVWQDKSS